jgi:hypothetical protein
VCVCVGTRAERATDQLLFTTESADWTAAGTDAERIRRRDRTGVKGVGLSAQKDTCVSSLHTGVKLYSGDVHRGSL